MKSLFFYFAINYFDNNSLAALNIHNNKNNNNI